MKNTTHYRQVVSFGDRLSLNGVFCLIAMALLAQFGGQAQAAVIAEYTFTSSLLTSSDSEANSAAGSITKGSGLDGMSVVNASIGNPLPSFELDMGNLGTAFDATDYIEFIVNANSGFFLNLSGNGAFTFDGIGDTGNWALRSSVDTFAANIGSGTTGTSFANNSVNLSTSFNQLSSVTFRLYAWNGATDADILFDNITLNGTVSPVPEVGTVWASLLVIGLAIAGKWRFGKKKLA